MLSRFVYRENRLRYLKDVTEAHSTLVECAKGI